jgi:hypothetical protein
LPRSADFQSAVSPIFNRQGVGTGSRAAVANLRYSSDIAIENLRYDFVTGPAWSAGLQPTRAELGWTVPT